MNRLPLTVIGGYLGAGKTTLINRLLSGDHGRRLTVMVNDFGAVNVDAALIRSVSADTMELTNGCVCCTMGADLFMAVGDVLDRPQRPDHVIIEASGIADPARIANVARAEPDLSYAGIVTVVDALHVETLLADPQIAPQIEAQIRVADLVLVSKVETPPADLATRLGAIGRGQLLPQSTELGPLLWDREGEIPDIGGPHAQFIQWSTTEAMHLTREALLGRLAARPTALYRIKGFVAAPDGGGHLVQVVGQSVDVTSDDTVSATQLVGIGLARDLDAADIEAWWETSAPARRITDDRTRD